MMSILRPHWPEKGNAVAGPLTPPLDSSSSAFRQRNHSTAALALNGANKTLRVGVHNPRLRCKTTPLVIGETSSASSHVLPENSILFFKIFDRILLEPVDPAGEGHDEQLQKVGLHGPDSSRSWRHPCLAPAVSQLPARARHCANRVLAHYGVLVVMILEMVQDLPDDAGLVMKETTRILPPQFLQINGSVLNTRRIKLAHRRRRVLRWVALSSSSSAACRFFGNIFYLIERSGRSTRSNVG